MLAVLLACVLLAGSVAVSEAAWKQDRIIITFWCPPPATDENLATVKADHYNLTWTPADGLDVAQRHGLKAMLQDYGLLRPASLDDPKKRAELDALIDRVKNHPAMEAYYIIDEPGVGAFEGLGRLAAYLRERDPAHFAYINLYPTYANEQQLGVDGKNLPKEVTGIPMNFAGVDTSDQTVLAYQDYLKRFVDTIKPELISYDHYHFLKGKDGKQYFLNLSLIREAALQAKVPFVNIIQASTIETSWRLPTAGELRWLVYTTLAYGGRGISYFLYWGPVSYGGVYQDGKRMRQADPIAALNEEIEALSPALMELDSLGAYHTDPLPYGGQAVPGDSPVKVTGGEFVLGMFGKNGKPTTFMIVNRDYKKSAAAHISLPAGTSSVREYDRKSRSWKTYTKPGKNGGITISLKPGDGRLLGF
jgi:hypothetical protein